jgi:hypothetical protein
MSTITQYGYPQVPKSITNPSVSDVNAIDSSSAMTFLVFLNVIGVSFAPETSQAYYNEYLNRWNSVKNNTTEDSRKVIVERYRDFIKDLSLNYSTYEEREFLSKIDYSDPYDLDTVMGFYSKKLIELVKYYNSKRESAKYESTRKKLKGSNTGLTKIILEKTLDFLQNRETAAIDYDLTNIKSKIKIDIDELYNVYGGYFNQTPDVAVYDYKDLDFGENIFLKDNADLVSTIFSGISEELRGLKEADVLFDTKRSLTEQSMGTDFYYLSTGSNIDTFKYDKLFSASKKSQNILNREYPTTASTFKGDLITKHEMGFFKPCKNSIIVLDGDNKQFTFDKTKLAPNSLYFFPDPNVFGGVSDVVVFQVDDSKLKRNRTSGAATNEPASTPSDTKYYAYTSSNDAAFEGIFESGYVQDLKTDVYGNAFGLFKTGFTQGITIASENNPILNLQLNGHEFYDTLYGEGYAFNYSTFDDSTYTETIRSGLSSNTSYLSALSGRYTLFFRYFKPYQELIAPTESNITPSFESADGAYIVDFNNLPYADPISSDLSAFPGVGVYYFSDLYDGGVHDASPIVPALLDPLYPSITGVLTETPRQSPTNNVEDVDGGDFVTPFIDDFELLPIEYYYDDTLFESSSFVVDAPVSQSYNQRYDLNGQIFVRNANTRQIKTLTLTVPYISSRYTASVMSELSAISRFDLAFDTLMLETSNYFIFEKIKFENSQFIDPKVAAYTIRHNTTPLDKLSNRFYSNNAVYYCTLTTATSSISSNDYILYPTIYKYDTLLNKNTQLFPLNDSDYLGNSQFFSVSGQSVRYVKAEPPIISYSSKNNIFSITFLLKDQNDMIYIHEYDLTIDESIVKFIKHNAYRASTNANSIIMTSTYSTSLSFYLSAGVASINNEEFIL